MTMKTVIRFLMVMVCVFSLTGCPEDPGGPCPGPGCSPRAVTMSFSAEFTTLFTKSTLPAGSYKDVQDSVCQLIQVGSGIDESIGNFDIYLTCCWSSFNGEHISTEGYISDIDGDVLNIVCNDTGIGVVFALDYPYNQTIMCSEFEFAGGTGKFTGATGSVIGEFCLKDAAAPSMEHIWEGVLILVSWF